MRPARAARRAHVVEQRAQRRQRLGPHQEDVGLLGGDRARVLRETAEVEERRAPRDGAHGGRLELELVELAAVANRLAVEQRAQDLHALARALVARRRTASGAPGRSLEMMLIVSRPPSMRSSVASWRASCGGNISPQRTATSSRMREVSGATPPAKATLSMPSA